MDGSGLIESTGSGAIGGLEVTWASRSEPDESGRTSPEELIAAAHAACFCMALSHGLAQAGNPPEKLDVVGHVDVCPRHGHHADEARRHRHRAGDRRGRRSSPAPRAPATTAPSRAHSRATSRSCSTPAWRASHTSDGLRCRHPLEPGRRLSRSKISRASASEARFARQLGVLEQCHCEIEPHVRARGRSSQRRRSPRRHCRASRGTASPGRRGRAAAIPAGCPRSRRAALRPCPSRRGPAQPRLFRESPASTTARRRRAGG